MRPDTPLVAAVRPSPNHGERRDGKRPSLVILHYTGMPAVGDVSAAECAVRWLCAPESQVSCHYVVDEDGTVLQLVPEARRAWHAGVAFWRSETDVNTASIGIEIVNPGHDFGAPPYPEPQIEAVIALLRDVLQRWSIAPDGVLGHSDVAPLRKADPGEWFPWERLAAAGVARAVPPQPASAAHEVSGSGRASGADPPPCGEGGRAGGAGKTGRGDWSRETLPPSRPWLRLGPPSPQGGGPAPAEGGCCRPEGAALLADLAAIGYGIEPGPDEATRRAVIRAFQRRWRPRLCDGVADAETCALAAALAAEDRARR